MFGAIVTLAVGYGLGRFFNKPIEKTASSLTSKAVQKIKNK